MGVIATLLNDSWLRTVAYLVAAALCLLAARRTSASGQRIDVRVVWIAMAVVLAGFALARASGIVQWTGHEVRRFAFYEGWYQQRRPFQQLVMGSIALAGMAAALVASRYVSYGQPQLLLGLMGMIYLVAFVVVRGVSFHNVDALLYRHTLGQVGLSALLELFGIAVVTLGAALAVRRE